MRRQAWVALVACTCLWGCASKPAPTLNPPAKVASAPCQQQTKCTVQIYFDSQGQPQVDIDEIVVRHQNAHIWWVLLPQTCSFGLTNGILLKNPNDDPRGQFDQKYVADNGEQQLPPGQRGPRYHWRDKYLVDGKTYYEINFTCDGTPYHIDPSIQNGQ